MSERRWEGDLTAEDKVAVAEGNRIWLNAFATVRPTDEFLRDLGAMVLRHLQESDLTVKPGRYGPVTYIRLNAS